MCGYIYTFKGHGSFSPEGKVSDSVNVQQHNKELQEEELKLWYARPDRFACYIVGAKASGRYRATLWMGEQIGYAVKTGEYTNNLGARIEAWRVYGSNGYTYYGRKSAEWSQFLRMRRGRECTDDEMKRFYSTGINGRCQQCQSDHGMEPRVFYRAVEEGKIETCDSFSWRQCDNCGSSLGGSREPAHYVAPDGRTYHEDVCTDCVMRNAGYSWNEDMQCWE